MKGGRQALAHECRSWEGRSWTSVPFSPSLRRGGWAAALRGNLMDHGTSCAGCGISAELYLMGLFANATAKAP